MSIQTLYPTSHPPSTLHYQSATLTAAILISENLSAQSSLSVYSWCMVVVALVVAVALVA